MTKFVGAISEKLTRFRREEEFCILVETVIGGDGQGKMHIILTCRKALLFQAVNLSVIFHSRRQRFTLAIQY